MIKIGVVGAGVAARLHAEATILARGVELVGVGGGARRGTELAAAVDAPNCSLADLCDSADALVLAIPGSAMVLLVPTVAEQVEAVMLEAPHDVSLTGPALTAANLLHSPATAPSLRAIARLHQPHHVMVRARRPGDARLEARRLAPLLFAATGTAAVQIAVDGPATAAAVAFSIGLDDGRTVRLEVKGGSRDAIVELEAADESGVVSVTWDPHPSLDVDGESVDLGEPGHPLMDLGYVGQIVRLAEVAAGHTEPWLPAATGAAIDELISSAFR